MAPATGPPTRESDRRARFTDDHFHNTGVQSAAGLPVDSGRSVGVRLAMSGEFNCLSRYSDAKPDDCAELQFTVTEGHELVRAFKTPSLRGVAVRAPYMHAGQIAALAEVISHYNRAPASPIWQSELRRIGMTSRERMQLEAFLRTLSPSRPCTPGHASDPASRWTDLRARHSLRVHERQPPCRSPIHRSLMMRETRHGAARDPQLVGNLSAFAPPAANPARRVDPTC